MTIEVHSGRGRVSEMHGFKGLVEGSPGWGTTRGKVYLKLNTYSLILLGSVGSPAQKSFFFFSIMHVRFFPKGSGVLISQGPDLVLFRRIALRLLEPPNLQDQRALCSRSSRAPAR